MSNSEIISAFCASWASLDVDTIMGYFAEDAVYYNIPMEPPNEGKAKIRGGKAQLANPKWREVEPEREASERDRRLVPVQTWLASEDGPVSRLNWNR